MNPLCRSLLPGFLLVTACAPAVSGSLAPAPYHSPTGFPPACGANQVEVMLLGTYHFAGSGSDAVRTDPEDVLSPQRQAELEDLARKLARWQPQQIAIEWEIGFADSVDARYRRYRSGTLAPSRNEVVQIGFRLAALLGHRTVHPIDHQMRLGNDSLGALMERQPGIQARSDSLLAVMQARTNANAQWMRENTIIDQLRRVNSEEALRAGNSFGMFGSFLAAGEGGNYGGPALLARWYERNMYMVHNITRVLRPETRRVLVIVGSGHVPPMRNILDESPDFCPVSPLQLLD
jgi:hypothetical protein